jgi:hypothetical protein
MQLACMQPSARLQHRFYEQTHAARMHIMGKLLRIRVQSALKVLYCTKNLHEPVGTVSITHSFEAWSRSRPCSRPPAAARVLTADATRSAVQHAYAA